MANNRGVKEEAAKAIAGETDPEKRLRKIYQRAHQVRNLTFERFRTDNELKPENVQKNEGVGDVLAHVDTATTARSLFCLSPWHGPPDLMPPLSRSPIAKKDFSPKSGLL